jgi:hypothetical protein
MNEGLIERTSSPWSHLLGLVGAYVACTLLVALAAQLGLFTSLFSHYISGDTMQWIENRSRFFSYEAPGPDIVLSHIYFQFIDNISPLLIPLLGMSAIVSTILIVGACGTVLSRRIGTVAAALIALNPFFWLVVLGPSKEPFALCIVSTSLALIMQVRLPKTLWLGAGLLSVIALFTRVEFACTVLLILAFILSMRTLRLERFTAPVILVVSLAVLFLIPLVFFYNPPLPNSRAGIAHPLMYEHYQSLAPEEMGSMSVSISHRLASNPWTGWVGVLYRIVSSTVHGPLRPGGMFTHDGRIAIYMTSLWLTEFFVTFGLPAAVLILAGLKASHPKARTLAAMAIAMSVFIGFYPIIQVRYLIPIAPIFIMLFFMIERRPRLVLALAVLALATLGPMTLFVLGYPPPTSINLDLAPGANPYLPSWIEHERPVQ